MAYYGFDRCPQELSEIERIISKLNAKEFNECPDGRMWECRPFRRQDGSEVKLYVSYRKYDQRIPLVLQTEPYDIDHKTPELREILRQFITACQPNKICSFDLDQLYDLEQFK